MASKYRYRNLLMLILVLCSSKYCFAIENITRSQNLSQDKTLVSQPGQVFELGFFSPNNSGSNQYVGIWYKQIPPRIVVWVLNRENPLSVADSSSARLEIGDDGNLELVDGNNRSVWSTGSGVSSNSLVVTLSDQGNLVFKDVDSEKTFWESFDHLGDTILPGSEIGFDGTTGKNDVLTSWKSEGDPSIGDFTVGISTKLMPAQVFTWKGTDPKWRSGPWDGSKFIGIPSMDETFQSPFDLLEDVEQGKAHLSFNPYNDSLSMKFFISSEGVLTLMVKEEGRDWSLDWESQTSPCDVYGVCGNFGDCKESESPICSCFKGYVPKSDLEWREQNWTQGCSRRVELLCERNTSRGKNDVFLELSNMTLPDFYRYMSFPKDTESCRTLCLTNCSCNAYAYITGIGCLVWSESIVDVQEFSAGGEALFLRLAHGELGGGTNKKKIIIIGLATISCIALSVFIAIFLCRRSTNRKRKFEASTEKSNFVKTSNEFRSNIQFTKQNYQSEFPNFDYESLSIATDHFRVENKLGQGGFGPVYKGKLQDGTEIAVKRLSSSSGQGPREFKNEMVLVSKLQHRNLVRLLGCCTENDEKLLVYEYMPNKSLDNFIFDISKSVQLDWNTRFNIITCIARGLVYLHRDSFLRVIHRDLKASNILLDEKMNPKISDFGLARIFQETLDLANTQRVVGTLGYMAPEYAMGGIFSEKSDVFSFGILILEIVSGRKNTSFKFYDQHLSLIGHAWHLWSEGRGLEMVDKAVETSYSPAEAMRCVHIGLLCVQDQAVDRPTMPDIVSMLINEIDRPGPKEPLFTFQRPPEVGQQNDTKYSADDATVSILEGR